MALGCRAIGLQDKDNPFDETAPIVAGFPLSASKVVLFKERGALTVSAQLEPEIAAASDLSWEVTDGSGVVTVSAESGQAVITPVSAGTATVTAKITAKEGFEFDESSNLISECRVVVLDSFTLDQENLLFFAGEAATQNLEVDLNSAQLAALSEVAVIGWEQTGEGAALPPEKTGVSVAVGAGSAATATVRATLAAKNAAAGASAPDFNGGGVNASASVTTLAVPTVTLDDISETMLKDGAGSNAYQTFTATAHYPPTLNSYNPVVAWASSDTAKAEIAPQASNPVAGGNAYGTGTAKAVGSPSISATLQVAGRSFGPVAKPVSIVAYVSPVRSVASVMITGAPSTLTQTVKSSVITGAALHSDGGVPDNTTLSWTQSSTNGGAVAIANEPLSDPNVRKITITGNSPGTVIVTATSQDGNKKQSFTVTVLAPVVSWTTAAPASFTYGGYIDLGATTNITNKNINWSISVGGSSASLSAASGATTRVSGVSTTPVTDPTPIKVRAASAENANAYQEHSVTINPHTFDIQYNENGGTGTTAAQNGVTYGSKTTNLSANNFSRTGWTFGGWVETADGTTAVTKVSNLNENSEAKKPTGGVVTLYAKWNQITYTVKYNNGGGTGTMADETVAHGTVYTIKAHTFTPPADKALKEWNVSGVGAKQPGNTITVTGNVTITAVWGDPQDLMVKFKIKPDGYTTATAADVTAVFNAVQTYVRSGVTGTNVDTSNAKLGVIALGDYVKLPRLQVADYGEGGGAFDKSNAVVEVVGINSYNGKNGNGNTQHLVFQFKESMVNRRISPRPVSQYEYSATEMRKYLTTVSGDSNSGKFLAGLVTAGVPQSVLWAPKRVIGKPSGGSISTITDLVSLPSSWEINKMAINANFVEAVGETSENSAWFSYYSPAGSMANLESDAGKKVRSKGSSWWFATPIHYDAATVGVFTILTAPQGYISYTQNENSRGVAPVFFVK